MSSKKDAFKFINKTFYPGGYFLFELSETLSDSEHTVGIYQNSTPCF